ncbi:MAG TPA: heme o synthase [Patescibacteria group bacterium]|nr:heme o synthase [Patescibacteria group bacterium]
MNQYYKLTKPGIVYGNSVAAIAGFLLASKTNINPGLGVAMLIGISLIIASACVVNNFIDRNIDSKMKRTKARALVTGQIPVKNAIIFAAVLGVMGILSLAIFTNWLTLGVALTGYFFYVVMYSIYKRRSVHGTVVGSISGAVPPVVGYVAVTNKFDLGALLLFLILVSWQMPHFYSIALYRVKEYSAASVPVMSIVYGALKTKRYIVGYVITFIASSLLLVPLGYTNSFYLVVMILLGVLWLRKGLGGFKAKDDEKWARGMFGLSLMVLMGFSIMISTNAWTDKLVYTFGMILVLHIAVALSSVIYTGYTYFKPSKTKLLVSYGLIAGMLATGTALVITKPSHLMSACVDGLAYLAIVLTGIALARQKLAQELSDNGSKTNLSD